MKKLTILISIFISTSLLAQNPNLVIPDNGLKILSPQKHKFDKIKIGKGAILRFKGNSARWAIIECNELILEGTIEYSGVRRGLNTIKGQLNTVKFEYDFPEISKGGAGSNGNSVPKGMQGGKGYKPQNADGGGGGSGAYYLHDAGTGRARLNGNDAIDYTGAIHPAGNNKDSGNGGRINPASNGGLIFIKCKTFTSNNGKILLNGLDGNNGSKSNWNGSMSVYAQLGASGNGGGSAGGDGGVLIVHYQNLNEYPMIEVSGGKGGKGAQATSAKKGENGEDGIDGYYDFIQY